MDRVHDEICAALRSAGGECCDLIVGNSPARRADILFREHRVIVEVKSLTTDRNRLESVQVRSGRIIQDGAREEGGPVVSGSVGVSLSDVPPRTAERLLMNLGGRVRDDLRDARKQIESTSAALGFACRGLVVFGVPAHFDTHPGVVATAAARVLSPGKYRSIDGIMLFKVQTGGEESRGPLTISFHPRSHSGLPEKLVSSIASAWIRYVGEKEGTDLGMGEGSFDDFEAIYLAGEDRAY